MSDPTIATEPEPLAPKPRRFVWRVRAGAVVNHPRTGETIAFAGQDLDPDDPAVLAHPSIGSDCYRVEIDDAPPPAAAPTVLICDTDPALEVEPS